MTRIRSSFALRLLTAGVALSLVLIIGISAFLLVSRSQQTRTAAVSTAGSRAKVVGQLFDNVTQPELKLDAKVWAKNDHDLVFPTANGLCWDPSNVRDELTRISADAGLWRVRPHELRH